VAKPIIVLHGCCKHVTPQRDVEAESREAAVVVGAQPDQVLVPYYACALNQQVIAGGHDADLPDECERPQVLQLIADHADTDWDQAMGELLADPANEARILELGLLRCRPKTMWRRWALIRQRSGRMCTCI